MFQSINPFTEEIFHEVKSLLDQELENKLSCSIQSFSVWSRFSLSKRVACVQNLNLILNREKQNIAVLITKEMGKPIKQSIAEIEKCARLCEYTVEQVISVLADKKHLSFAPENSYITYQPLGPILGIMPWNFPFWQVFRFVLPTLLSGNTILIKQAPNVMLCGIELEKLFIEAGFPNEVYQNLPVSIEQSAKVIADHRVRGVSLTGSVSAGRAVASLAGRFLKKSLLELGGNDPYVILDSADLHLAAKECVLSRMNNSGQSCIAAKRFIVTDKNAEAFVSCIKEEMRVYEMGNPLLMETNLGPLARKDLRDRLHKQVNALIHVGAKVLMGGTVPARRGYFYPPTVLCCSVRSIADFDEELFGPVAFVITVSNEEEAIQAANNSSYGLGAAVFSQDMEKAEKLARDELQAGSCVVNQALHSHPALPFGGIKDSGYGRELSFCGFYEFVNIKTIQT